MVESHREQFVRPLLQVARDRPGGEGLPGFEPLVLPAVSEVGNHERYPPGLQVPHGVEEQQELDDFGVRVGRGDHDDALPLEGGQDSHVPLAVGEPAGVLLVGDLDELAARSLREFAGQAHARGPRDDLHRATQG